MPHLFSFRNSCRSHVPSHPARQSRRRTQRAVVSCLAAGVLHFPRLSARQQEQRAAATRGVWEKALAASLMGRGGLGLRRRMRDPGPGTTPAATPYSVSNVQGVLGADSADEAIASKRAARPVCLRVPGQGVGAGTRWQPLPPPPPWVSRVSWGEYPKP